MTKKMTAVILAALLTFSLAACSQGGQSETETAAAAGTAAETTDTAGAAGTGNAETENAETAGGETSADGTEGSAGTADDAQTGNSNILIAYFSVMETDGADTVASASRVVSDGELLGNTQYIAQIIQQETGGDLFRIETVQEYPTTHDPLLEFAYNERGEDARPELSSQIENPDSYDVIFLGFPNWNADLPMPLYTFLESYDFSGKTIIPFTTHGGSGFSRNIQTISELQPDANVISDGLSISRNDVAEAESDVVNWVSGLDLSAE